ncbi:hypothetical protein PAMC26577_23745 [Caballeronia sordidicola]|uniref:Uncharacterized protein n=1 Tax=Caballeronia sordidicola TaxID=196367 RepID=A0A242MJI4_CABSO|nr:hypothetical protein PAMC26577_23745 [Caballeronia sordidicola]
MSHARSRLSVLRIFFAHRRRKRLFPALLSLFLARRAPNVTHRDS